MSLRRLLVPDLYLASVLELDPGLLRSHGIRGVILDLDNTLVRWNHPQPGDDLRGWLERLGGAGLRACIVSNNGPERVDPFARTLGVPAIAKAGKPRRRAYRRAMALMGTASPETAVVGDQIFTDILGGKRLGLFTVLVAPISRREFVGTRLVRLLEGAWLAYLRRRGLLRCPGGGRPAPRGPGSPQGTQAGKGRGPANI